MGCPCSRASRTSAPTYVVPFSTEEKEKVEPPGHEGRPPPAPPCPTVGEQGPALGAGGCSSSSSSSTCPALVPASGIPSEKKPLAEVCVGETAPPLLSHPFWPEDGVTP